MFPHQSVRNRTFSARLDCHYLLHEPDAMGPHTLLVAALHGFSSNPETMLRLAGAMFGAGHAIAALQGPYQFYTDVKAEQIGYGWITRRHAPSSIRLHHEMTLHVLHEAGAEFGIPPERRILLGFSQPVSLNYRLAATHPESVRGVVGICGGLPSDWETGDYKPVRASLLHIARSGDDVYPPAVSSLYAERLRRRASDVEFHMLEGGHRFPSKAAPIAAAWLSRIL